MLYMWILFTIIALMVVWMVVLEPSSWKLRLWIANLLVGKVAVCINGDGEVVSVYHPYNPDASNYLWRQTKSTSAALRAANAKLKEQVALLQRDKQMMLADYEVLEQRALVYKMEAIRLQEYAKA